MLVSVQMNRPAGMMAGMRWSLSDMLLGILCPLLGVGCFIVALTRATGLGLLGWLAMGMVLAYVGLAWNQWKVPYFPPTAEECDDEGEEP